MVLAKKSNIKSWKDLSKYKERINITFNDEVLFCMVEPSDEVIDNIYSRIEDSNVGDFITDSSLVAYVLRNICQDISFEDMTDEEIVKEMNNMGDKVVDQINNALEKLVNKKINNRLEKMEQLVKRLEELNTDALDSLNEVI